MELASPWWLVGLTGVVATALWALLRPARQLAVVGSLELWQKAADALDRSVRRRSRRVTASWVLLLAGSVAGVLSLARPVYHAGVQARRVAIEICPSAELAGPGGMDELRSAAGALLDRLESQDRVRLVLPAAIGGSSDWLTPSEARGRIGALQAVPVRAEEVRSPAVIGEAQHAYRFRPAGTNVAWGPDISVVELPTHLAPVTIEAVGAAELPGGRMQILVALRGGSANAWTGRIAIRTFDGAGAPQSAYTADATTRQPVVAAYPASAALEVEVLHKGGAPVGVGDLAALVRSRADVRKAAMLGADEPKVRRYVEIDRLLQLVAEAKDAVVVIAYRVDPPAEKPALVICPSAPPLGWQKGEAVGPILLADATVTPDDPVTRDVDLGGVAVRRATPWLPGETQSGISLVTWRRAALVLRNDPDAETGPVRPPRRVYLAFPLGGENTNLATSEAFVVLLANAMRWLPQTPGGGTEYGFVSPQQAGTNRDWQVVGAAPRGGALPWPGLYKDSSGGLHAVSVVGLRSAEPAIAPARAVAELRLPAPRYADIGREFWPWLVVAAIALCLAGWAMRVR